MKSAGGNQFGAPAVGAAMQWFRILLSAWLIAAMAPAVVSAATVALPRTAPLPRPGERPMPPPADMPMEVPVPTQKPDATPSDEKPPETEGEPERKPVPPDPRSSERPRPALPAEETACRTRLRALGVEFEASQALHDEKIGCAVPYPLAVKTLGREIGLIPEAEMNCPMAEAAARFMANTVSPAARTQFGAKLKSVNQASAYVCRPRHNGEKMSEHAFGNALDIASFTLADDTRIEVEATPMQKNAEFLSDVRKAACGPFKTVLGPGSDPDHATHLHLDLEPRRNGGAFCQ